MTILYCNSKEHIIENKNGKEVTIEKAKKLYNNCQVKDCNLSFQRLASFDFNWNELDRFYEENN